MTAGGTGWLVAVSTSRVGTYMISIVYAATLPVLQDEWHLSGTAAGSIASAFQIGYALSLMASSELADRIGARRADDTALSFGSRHRAGLARQLR